MAIIVPSSLRNVVSAVVPNSSALCEALGAIAERIDIKKGTVLLREGTVCRHIYFVAGGCFRIFTIANGVEVNTDFIFEGHFATSLRSLRTSSDSEFSIQAYESSEVYRFSGSAMLDLYKTTPGAETLGRSIIEGVLMRQEEHANTFKTFSGKERYQFLADNHPQIIQRISLTQIASYIGVARETLSRIRRP